jgi:hypothetical protein
LLPPYGKASNDEGGGQTRSAPAVCGGTTRILHLVDNRPLASWVAPLLSSPLALLKPMTRWSLAKWNGEENLGSVRH